jgi:SAM-dependent methyltransferase
MLHISPEEGLEENFRRISSLTYVTADLNLAPMMVKIDITGIPFLDHSFDILYCSHVLEHIQNDRKAMDELNRVLKPGGHAIVQVPIADGKTFEDPSVTNPAERKQLFGQSDHVRRYGWDFKDRLEESGFSVRLLSASEIANENRLPTIGIPMDEVVFLARSKPFVKDHSDNLSLFQIRNG